jgi:hypothetical protein
MRECLGQTAPAVAFGTAQAASDSGARWRRRSRVGLAEPVSYSARCSAWQRARLERGSFLASLVTVWPVRVSITRTILLPGDARLRPHRVQSPRHLDACALHCHFDRVRAPSLSFFTVAAIVIDAHSEARRQFGRIAPDASRQHPCACLKARVADCRYLRRAPNVQTSSASAAHTGLRSHL